MLLTRDIYSKQLLQVKNRFLKPLRSYRSIYSKTKDSLNNIDEYMKTGRSTTWKDARSYVVTKHLRDLTASHLLSQSVRALGFLPMLKRTIVASSDTKDLIVIYNLQ